MAVFLDVRGNSWTYDDGKLDFPSWLAADPARQAAWEEAGKAFLAYKTEHGKEPVESESSNMFRQWMAEVHAMPNGSVNVPQ